jgi:predicted secreted protein
MPRYLLSRVLFLFVAYFATRNSPGMSRVYALTEQDSGTTVQINVGDTLELFLKSAPTTGYVWNLVTIDQAILQETSKTQSMPSNTKIGGESAAVFYFLAVAPGKSFLELGYRRSFEKTAPPAKIFQIRVLVRPASPSSDHSIRHHP